MSGLKMKAAGGGAWLLMIALVAPAWTRYSAAGLAATTGSQASSTSAPPEATRTA